VRNSPTDEMDQAFELAGRLIVSLAVCAVVLIGMLIGFMLT
jgi:hypothetical protein